MIEGRSPSERYDAPDDAAHAAPRNGAAAPVEASREFDAHGSAPDATGASFPWPPAEDASVAGAFVGTWQGATFQPTKFFRALPERASLGSALLYYLPLGIIIAGADLFWRIVRPPAEQPDSTLSTVAATEAAVHPLVWFLLSPLLLILSLFLSAAATHVVLKLFGGASRDYSMTTRVFSFAHSPMFFSVVPVIGAIIGFIWMVVAAIIGVREAHRTTIGRAVAAVLIPVIFALIVLGLAYLARAAGTLLNTPV